MAGGYSPELVVVVFRLIRSLEGRRGVGLLRYYSVTYTLPECQNGSEVRFISVNTGAQRWVLVVLQT